MSDWGHSFATLDTLRPPLPLDDGALGLMLLAVGLLYTLSAVAYVVAPWISLRHFTLARAAGVQQQAKKAQMERLRDMSAKPIESVFPEGSTATQLLHRMRTGQLSCSEVCRSFVRHAAHCDQRLNCITEAVADEALAAALAVDGGEDVKPLSGLPVSVKDQYDQRGALTTCGMMTRISTPMAEDGLLVELLRDAGAIPFVRTNVPQLLLLPESVNNIFGATCNPWDLSRSCGGSSGGEAALIAANGSPIGVGTDIGGSVRIPAHFCGIAALKVSSNRVTKLGLQDPLPQDLYPSPTVEMAAPGPMGHSVADLALILRAWLQPKMWDADVSIPRLPFDEEQFSSCSKLTVGVWRTDPFFPAAPSCVRAVDEAVGVLRKAGHKIVEFSPPRSSEVLPMYLGILDADGGCEAFVKGLAGERPLGLYAPIFATSRLPGWLRGVIGKFLGVIGQKRVQGIVNATGGKTVGDYWALLARREEYRKDFLGTWRGKGLDVLLCPGYGLPALPHGAAADLAPCALYTLLFNLLQYSAGVVPVCCTKPDECVYTDTHNDVVSKAASACLVGSAGLPVGVQVVTLPFQEELCLRVMAEVESGVDFKSKHRQGQSI